MEEKNQQGFYFCNEFYNILYRYENYLIAKTENKAMKIKRNNLMEIEEIILLDLDKA